jgi:hypothetical protein
LFIVGLSSIGVHSRDRAFSIAFAIVGGGFLLIAMTESSQLIRDSLPTKYILAIGWKLLADPQVYFNPPFPIQPMPFNSILEYTGQISLEGAGAFFLIGNCVFSWLFAILAGWFAGHMFAKRAKIEKS